MGQWTCFVFCVLAAFLAYCSATTNIEIVKGENATFHWKYQSEAYLILIAKSNELELGEWYAGGFEAEDMYKDRLEFKIKPAVDGEEGSITLVLCSTSDDDCDATYSCISYTRHGSPIHINTHLTCKDKSASGQKVIVTPCWLIAICLLYLCLPNKVIIQDLILSCVIMIVLGSCSVTANNVTKPECKEFKWLKKETTKSVAPPETLNMKWKYETSYNTTQVELYRFTDRGDNEILATVSPGENIIRKKNVELILKSGQTTYAISAIYNTSLNDIKYKYNIRVELQPGCFKDGTPIIVFQDEALKTIEKSGIIGQNVNLQWEIEDSVIGVKIFRKRIHYTEKEDVGSWILGEDFKKNTAMSTLVKFNKTRSNDITTINLILVNTRYSDYHQIYYCQINSYPKPINIGLQLLITKANITRDSYEHQGQPGDKQILKWKYKYMEKAKDIIFRKENISPSKQKTVIGKLIGNNTNDSDGSKIFQHVSSPTNEVTSGEITLTLLKTTTDDYNAYYSIEVLFTNGDNISPDIKLTLCERNVQSTSGYSHTYPVTSVILTSLLLTSKGPWRFLFVLIYLLPQAIHGEDALMAQTEDLCHLTDFQWMNIKDEVKVNNEGNLYLKWKYETSHVTMEIIFYRQNPDKTIDEIMAKLKPADRTFKTSDNRMEFIVEKFVNKRFVLNMIYKTTVEDIGRTYYIRVELQSGCLKYSSPIKVLEGAITEQSQEGGVLAMFICLLDYLPTSIPTIYIITASLITIILFVVTPNVSRVMEKMGEEITKLREETQEEKMREEKQEKIGEYMKEERVKEIEKRDVLREKRNMKAKVVEGMKIEKETLEGGRWRR